MRSSTAKLLCTALVVFGIAMLLAAVAVFVRAIPQKRHSESVSSLQTAAVFESESVTVEPEREAVFEGSVEVPLEQTPEEPAVQPEVSSDPTYAPAAKRLAEMTQEEKIWQLFFVTPESLTGYPKVTRAGEATREALLARPVGGLIYFPQNLETREQVMTLTKNAQSYVKTPLFLGINEEGGALSHLAQNKDLGVTALAAMAEYGANGDSNALYAAVSSHAGAMKALGFNMNFAPVADVSQGENAAIANRAFSSSADLCATMTGASVRAMQEQGIAACLKHFPGYGSITAGADAVLSRTAEELSQIDLLPFTAGIADGASFVMVSHLSVPSVTGGEDPADVSSKIVTDLLRTQLGFGGIIITEAQQDESFSAKFDSSEAAVRAIEAGCDMILMPKDLQAAYDGITAAVSSGRLTAERIDESVLRILQTKIRMGIAS
ncbi:MAG: glycoside hydrolase family 3 protein [Oscillospiraceae bacterium]|nr:glycoside hydrolase family 3 protein [Oscillospiraceae bacterium]